MSSKPRKRPCRLCGQDLNLWGSELKGICPDCNTAKKQVKIPCAGRCKKMYTLRNMEPIRINFDPGWKNGTKLTLYYCSTCIELARSRSVAIKDRQQEALEQFESRRSCLKGDDE